MLGIGWTEMLVIGVMALIVIGPKELPGLMQKLGRMAATVRRMGNEFQRELNKTTGLDEVKNLRNAITQPLKQTTDAIRKEFNTISSTGAVQPSGAIKPTDPAAESVVDEIKAAAGMTPAESIKAAVTKATAAPAVTAAAAPVKAKRVVKAKPAPTAPVATAALAPAKPAPKRAAAKPKQVESPAPVEALPPAKKAAPKPKAAAPARKPAAKKA